MKKSRHEFSKEWFRYLYHGVIFRVARQKKWLQVWRGMFSQCSSGNTSHPSSTAEGSCTWDGGSDTGQCGGTVMPYSAYSVEQGVKSLQDCKAKCESQSKCKEIFWWGNIDAAKYDKNKEKNCFLSAVNCSPNAKPYQSTSRPGTWLPKPPFTKYKTSSCAGTINKRICFLATGVELTEGGTTSPQGYYYFYFGGGV